MSLTTKCIPASCLSTDGDIAQFIYDTASAAGDNPTDPLEILMQREAEGEFTFHEEDGVQYPHFAPSYN